MKQYMINGSMRMFFLFVASVMSGGIWLTGVSVAHWLLFVPPGFFYFASITGICPGLIISRLLFGPRASR